MVFESISKNRVANFMLDIAASIQYYNRYLYKLRDLNLDNLDLFIKIIFFDHS